MSRYPNRLMSADIPGRPLLLHCVIAAAAGALASLGWAPVAAWPVAVAAYAALFGLVRASRSVREAALLAASFGFALHLAGHGWAYDAMRIKAATSMTVALAGSTVFVVYLALFTVLSCVLWRLAAARRGFGGAAAWAAAMTLGEWARSEPFNGFPSLSLGYALIDTPWAGLAPWAGVYALGFAGFAMAAGMVAVERRRFRAAAAAAGVLTLAGLAGSRLNGIEPHGSPLSFRLVQGNVEQQRKFDPAHRAAQIADYARWLTEAPADLVVTPETAFPLFLTELPPATLQTLERFSASTSSHLLLGVATWSAGGAGHNSVVHVAPEASSLGRYDKVRLMPFGEYTPAGFGWFTGRLQISLKDLAPGVPQQPPFEINGQRVGVLICSEDLVAEPGRRWVASPASATLLVNPSNLAWFADSWALPQRLQIARMRALELGRPLLRVANTGISAVIDHRGNVLASLQEGHTGVLSGRVQGMQGLTPYARLGDAPVLVLCGCLLAFAAARLSRAPRLAPAPPTSST